MSNVKHSIDYSMNTQTCEIEIILYTSLELSTMACSIDKRISEYYGSLTIVALLQNNDQILCVPLHFASINGHLDIAKFLIEEKGCDPMCRTKKGHAALHLACEKGHFDLVKYLIEERGCDPMCIDDDCDPWVPLHFANSNGHRDIIKFLIEEKGCDPMCRTKTGHAPLHIACQEGHFDIVKYLIEERGCDPMCLQNDDQFQYVTSFILLALMDTLTLPSS